MIQQEQQTMFKGMACSTQLKYVRDPARTSRVQLFLRLSIRWDSRWGTSVSGAYS